MLVASSLVVSCAGKDDEELEYVETPVEELYTKALNELAKKRYSRAALFFDEVERQHPYSVWARRAMLLSAYSYYESNKYDEAINAADRFIALHPGNEDVAYAYYLKAICNYERISDVGRDQQMTVDTFEALREVVRRFPNSEYARDARLKIDMTQNHLAGKEMNIGRFYMKQHNYVAAINRFKVVIEDYQTTAHTAEALYRLVECYLALGIDNEAQVSAAVLGYNYPGSDWYQDAYHLLARKDIMPEENEKSWISRAFNRGEDS
ncbi:MAG: outer membrane protein assembly factor BamD [Alphaproteobacteria bacterium]|nr:MAG: outer membrane protein assembly factor BamD [Alphaproteobacteria bacterium]